MPVEAHLRKLRILSGQREKLVARLGQRLMTEPAAVLELEVKAGGNAQAADRRRADRENDSILVGGIALDDALGQGLGGQVGTVPLAPVLEADEQLALALAAAGIVEAIDHEGGVDHRRFILQQVMADLVEYRAGARLRGTRRCLDLHEHKALVLVRQERRRQLDKHDAHGSHDRRVDDQPASGAGRDVPDPMHIPVPAFVEGAVEPAKESLLLAMVLARRLQQHGAQGRCERERDEHRQQHRRNDRERELAVDPADRATGERHRHEYSAQHHRHPDQRTADLSHRLAGGLKRGQSFLVHHALDVLDHHDGVVHQQADGQHQAEHRQRVDGEAKRRHHAEGAEQDHRHRDRGDQRGAEVLQEQVHHQEHQDDAFH
ncbi:hypothetical protein D9M68_165610 [compost metagenome]